MKDLMCIYQNGNYSVKLYSDGTKIRSTDEDEFKPAFAETIDVTISKRCDVGCKFCYAKCTPEGKKANLMEFKNLLDTLPPHTELAINGNDPSDKDLLPFLEYCKDRGIIVNMTVNQVHFIRDYFNIAILLQNDLIKGLGVSLQKPTDYFISLAETVPNLVVHTIAGITTREDYLTLADNGLKVLVLGYKNVGRGIDFYKDNEPCIKNNIAWLKSMVRVLSTKFSVLSFDNLALQQLDIQHAFSDIYKDVYMGEEGKYSFYMDLVDKKFYTSSLESEGEGHELLDSVIEMAKIIREKRD